MYVLFNNNNNKNWKKRGCLVPLNLFVMFLNMCINLNFLIIQSNFWYSYYEFSITFFFFIQFFFQSLFISCFLQNCMLKLFFYHSPNSCRRERGTKVYCSFKSFDIFTVITPIWNSDLLLTKQRQENFLQYCKDSLWMTDWVFSFRMFHIINLPG